AAWPGVSDGAREDRRWGAAEWARSTAEGARVDAEDGVERAEADGAGRERDEPEQAPPAPEGEAEGEDEQAQRDADEAVGVALVDGEAFGGGRCVCHGDLGRMVESLPPNCDAAGPPAAGAFPRTVRARHRPLRGGNPYTPPARPPPAHAA